MNYPSHYVCGYCSLVQSAHRQSDGRCPSRDGWHAHCMFSAEKYMNQPCGVCGKRLGLHSAEILNCPTERGGYHHTRFAEREAHKPKPAAELPPFWWEDYNGRPGTTVKPDAAMAATRAMCGATAKGD